MTTTTETTHPTWCDPRKCEVELVKGDPTGAVYHVSAETKLGLGVSMTLARVDHDGVPGPISTYLNGSLPDRPVKVAELERLGAALAQQARGIERRPLPPIRCEPWCKFQDGHPGQVFADDQCCSSEGSMTPASCYPAVEEFDGTYVPPEIAVYAMHRSGERIFVEVSLNEADTLKLTAREAREIGAHLIEESAVDSWADGETVLDEENGLAVRDTDTGSVYLQDGEGWDYSFAPDEARALAFALLVHAAHADRVEVNQ